MLKRINTAKELTEVIKENEDSPIFLGCWNGYSNTYCVADHAIVADYEEIANDFYGTEGKMDRRLFNGSLEGKKIIFIGSEFDWRVPNKDIDFLDDDPNQPIELINGENGDHDLFWKSNNFERVEKMGGGVYWSLLTDDFWVAYYPSTKVIHVEKGKNEDDQMVFNGKCIGLYDFFDIMKACKIEKTWRVG